MHNHEGYFLQLLPKPRFPNNLFNCGVNNNNTSVHHANKPPSPGFIIHAWQSTVKMSPKSTRTEFGVQQFDYRKSLARRTGNSRTLIFILFISSFFCAAAAKNGTAKSLHEILGPVIVMGNIFSIFPTSGIFAQKVENIRFRIYNPIAIYSIIVQFCFMTELVLLFFFLSKSGLKFFMIGELLKGNVFKLLWPRDEAGDF